LLELFFFLSSDGHPQTSGKRPAVVRLNLLWKATTKRVLYTNAFKSFRASFKQSL